MVMVKVKVKVRVMVMVKVKVKVKVKVRVMVMVKVRVMKSKITEITPEQEALIPVYREKYRQYGLSTTTDRKKAEEAVTRSYEYLCKTGSEGWQNCKPKKLEFMWVKNPYEGCKFAAKFNKGVEWVTKEEISAQIEVCSMGSLDASDMAKYGFIAEVLAPPPSELSIIAEDIVKECGMYWTFEDLVIMCPKPSSFEKQPDGSTVAVYADGWRADPKKKTIRRNRK